jgi:hypothetical protein
MIEATRELGDRNLTIVLRGLFLVEFDTGDRVRAEYIPGTETLTDGGNWRYTMAFQECDLPTGWDETDLIETPITEIHSI